MSEPPRPLVVPFDGAAHFAPPIAEACGGERVAFDSRHFPDGETYLRLDVDPSGRDVVLVAALDRPDTRLLPVLLACDTLRDLGAARIVLVAPYLPYMRQDGRFRPGEAVSARYIARMLSERVDLVVTVDPHLHRIGGLTDIFATETRVVPSAPAVAAWIAEHIASPVVVGPDEESGQWVEDVAARLNAPAVVLEKERHGDRSVEVSEHGTAFPDDHHPVLLDDIISSGMTMIEAARLVRQRTGERPTCIGVHAIFATGAAEGLDDAATRVVSTNTVLHASNAIDVGPLLAAAVAEALA